jgi:hypothetical protein
MRRSKTRKLPRLLFRLPLIRLPSRGLRETRLPRKRQTPRLRLSKRKLDLRKNLKPLQVEIQN